MAGLETWDPQGPSEALEVSESVCLQLVMLSPLAVFKLCVFLMLISPSCWKAKHSLCTQMLTDVLCTTQLPLKLTQTHAHTGDSNTYPSCSPSRDNLPGILEEFNKFYYIP